MTDLPWLRGKPHICDGSCPHRAGIMDEGRGGPTSPVEGGTAQAPATPSPPPDDLCEDCWDPLSKHDGPNASNPWTACKRFIPLGPKS